MSIENSFPRAPMAGPFDVHQSSRPSHLLDRFQPGELWPDAAGVHINAHGGGVLFDDIDGVYFWFGEHKTGGESGNLAHVGVRVYSSTDLYNWTDRGVAL